MKVLIVDDSSTMRRIVENVVKQIGVASEDIRQASDGVFALKELNKDDIKFDIVLTDWNMPNMNGLELVQRIKANTDKYYSKIPLIMITTEGGKGEVITALKAGVNNYIVKPFDAQTLQEKLRPFVK